MTDQQPKRAVIYCRVSAKKQKKVGRGLESQEHLCRQYATSRGYDVLAVFNDDFTGGGDFMNRRGMVGLIEYLESLPEQNVVVIFDDMKRFARDTVFHFLLKDKLKALGATIESPNYRFGDTPEDEFAETVIAAQGQLERKQNRRQTIHKMRARVERGYWVFWKPMGYEYKKTLEHGKLLHRVEPIASILQEGLEGYASGRFETQAEVKRFFESFPTFPKNKLGEVTNQRVKDLLTQPVYAGYVQAECWGIGPVKGHHEPLIDYATYKKIQNRLNGKAKVPNRKDLDADFPLRGFVLCGDCEKPLTACWSTSKTKKKHAYYYCFNKDCNRHRESIRRDQLEGDFQKILETVQPAEHIFCAGKAMFKALWHYQSQRSATVAETLKIELRKIDKQIDTMMDRVVEAESSAVITAYEKRIKKLEERKVELNEKTNKTGGSHRPFEEMFELAMGFLANPVKLWHSERLEDKRTVLKLTFGERLAYLRNEGFRTPKTTLSFKVLGDICSGKNEMAHRGRFELPTP